MFKYRLERVLELREQESEKAFVLRFGLFGGIITLSIGLTS